jgi:hypothetical protein
MYGLKGGSHSSPHAWFRYLAHWSTAVLHGGCWLVQFHACGGRGTHAPASSMTQRHNNRRRIVATCVIAAAVCIRHVNIPTKGVQRPRLLLNCPAPLLHLNIRSTAVGQQKRWHAPSIRQGTIMNWPGGQLATTVSTVTFPPAHSSRTLVCCAAIPYARVRLGSSSRVSDTTGCGAACGTLMMASFLTFFIS